MEKYRYKKGIYEDMLSGFTNWKGHVLFII